MNALNVLTLFFFNIIAYNIALLYGTVGEIITEKSGSLNLGVEGTMAVGAIGGYLMGCQADSLVVGVFGAFCCAAICGLLFAFLTVTLKANQNVTGLTITTFGLAIYFVIGRGLGNAWPVLRECANLSKQIMPADFGVLSDIPFLGKVLFQQSPLVYLGIAIAIVIGIYIKYTKSGLKMRAIGENPRAADAIGINVNSSKYRNIILGSGIMGIGGYYMGLLMSGSFEGSNCWINGYGWISIALVIFANWSPFIAILGTFVFGFFNTLQIYNAPLAATFPEVFGWLGAVPSQLFKALPFIITAIVLILTSLANRKKHAQPAALGVNYYREDR